jgi:hypothetical protein
MGITEYADSHYFAASCIWGVVLVFLKKNQSKPAAEAGKTLKSMNNIVAQKRGLSKSGFVTSRKEGRAMPTKDKKAAPAPKGKPAPAPKGKDAKKKPKK